MTYSSFWVGSVLSLDAPSALTLSWHGLGILLLAVGVVSLQLLQVHTPYAWLGWSAVVLILLGFVTFVELMVVGTLIFGAAVVLARRFPRAGGAFLASGAGAFLVTAGINGPFWSEENPQPSLIPSTVFIVALLLIAIGWALLGFSKMTDRLLTSHG